MKFYPVYLNLTGRRCLIAGGGRVAERKVLSLIEAGAAVTIVSPSLTEKLEELLRSCAITHLRKTFEDKDIAGAYLVIAATDSESVNSAIAKLCKQSQVLVNVAAPPEESTFIVPSVVDRGELLIAVSTGGSSPALTKKIRQGLEKTFGPEYGLFLEKIQLVRKRVMREVPEESARRAVFQAIVDSDVLDLLKQGRMQEADQRLAKISGLNKLNIF